MSIEPYTAPINQPKQAGVLYGDKVLRLTRISFATIVLSGLVACGGGGGGGGGVIPSSPYQPSEPISVSPTVFSGTLEQQTVVNATDAWTAGYKGQGITIAVVDSGVNPDHHDFYDDSGYSRINWSEGRSMEYDIGSDSIITTNDYRDIDSNYHGTHVSSIALGREYGVAPEATLLPLNVFLDNGTAYNTAIHAAVDYSASRAPIINTSISGMVNLSLSGAPNELNSYINTLTANDAALVVSAGNGGVDEIGDPVGAEHFINYNSAQNLAIQPGIADQVLNVIALTDGGVRTSFSNYPGSCADVTGSPDLACNAGVMTDIQNTFISVPGQSIRAAYGGTDTTEISYNGTSMAAPIVSGGLALLMSAWDQLTIQQAVNILKTTADSSGVYSDPAEYGVGLMDINAALGPVGALKSAAIVSPAFTPSQSSSSVPSSFGGLMSSPAFKSVALFDDFNREFMVDITPSINTQAVALQWDKFFENTQPKLQTQTQFGRYALTFTIDPVEKDSIEAFSLQSKQQTLLYLKNSSAGLVNPVRKDIEPSFYSDNQEEYGQSLLFTQVLSPKLSLISALQTHEQVINPLLNRHNNQTSLYSAGLQYEINPNLNIGVTAQLRQEKHSLMQLKGTGALSFGEENTSQINALHLSYNHQNTNFFGQLQYGQLLNSRQTAGSYLDVQKAEIGQLTFGLLQKTPNNASFGLQTYNYNSLLATDIDLSVPTSVDSNGVIHYQTSKLTSQKSLAPDSVELFYRSPANKAVQYQFNLINTPEDSGLGFKLHSTF